MDSKHDAAFINILREEKNIASFLDFFFGFLYRCTDFYIESTPDQRLGFPPGIAEKIVVSTLHKWQNLKSNPAVPLLVEELTIRSDDTTDNNIPDSTKKSSQQSTVVGSKTSTKNNTAPECYNGASYENYMWSQSIDSLDVVVFTHDKNLTAKDVHVNLAAETIEVAISSKSSSTTEDSADPWQTLLKEKFLHRIKLVDSFWNLQSGNITLYLEKESERWWEALLENEPRIELSKIDCTRNLEEMGEHEQMKVEELMWNQKRKLLGQRTSDQIRTEQILRQAWNADGSPFKGTEYDPSVLKFNN